MRVSKAGSANNVVGVFQQLAGFYRRGGLAISGLALPMVFAAVASIGEGLTFALLVPTLEGIMKGGFGGIGEIPVLRDIIALTVGSNASFGYQATVLVILTFIAAFAKIIFSYLSALGLAYQIKKMSAVLRNEVYKTLLSYGKQFFDRQSVGHLQQIITTYITVVCQALNVANSSLYAVFTLFTYGILMLAISWKLTIAVMLVFPFLHVAMKSLIERIKRTSDVYLESFNELGRELQNTLSNIPLIQSYCNEEREARRFSNISEQVGAFEYSIEKKTLLVGPLQEIILLAFLFGFVMAIGFLIAGENQEKLAQFAVYLVVLKRATTLFGIFNTIQSSLAGVAGPLAEVDAVLQGVGAVHVHSGPESFQGFSKELIINHLNFSYADGRQVLSDVSMAIKVGEVTALVGHTGSGKSTIVSLLMRFYDCRPGEIIVDGRDVREYSIQSWRSRIALVSQDAFLFHASLRDNLCYGLPRPPEERTLWNALEQAYLKEFVEKLPAGLDTPVGDRGVVLSGGERQRVSIARAILKDAEFLILDEATSAMDSETEKLIDAALSALMQGRTTLVIAHRLSTVRRANQLYVLDNGKVVESGSFDELCALKGRFYSFWERQQL